jgi:hypothetical protein
MGGIKGLFDAPAPPPPPQLRPEPVWPGPATTAKLASEGVSVAQALKWVEDFGNGNPVRIKTYQTQIDNGWRPGGCFSGDTLIQLADRSLQRMDCVQPGQRVHTGDGEASAVRHVVRFALDPAAPEVAMVRLATATLMTPWHPVRTTAESAWVFPAHSKIGCWEPQTPSSLGGYVYNLVLDRGHSVLADGGVECVTLAHGLEDSSVVAHPFWGTDAVVRALRTVCKRDETDDTPCVLDVPADAVLERDPATGLASGMVRKF